MNLAYFLISRLLQYPDDELQQFQEQARSLICELDNAKQRELINSFLCYLQETPVIEKQQTYVATFDFNKRASLHLSFHSLGDRRERGMAMLNVKQRFRAAGFEIHSQELPDYLPVLLEFCAFAEPTFGNEVLAEFRPAIELVRAALRAEESPYQSLLDALLLVQSPLTEAQLEQIKVRAAQGPPSESVGLEPFAVTEKDHLVGALK